MLSQTCKIAIKAVIYLSGKSDNNEKASIKEIAEQINASEHTVGKTLQQLVKHKIINSLKGPYGGFFLSDIQQEQPISNIVETIEGVSIFRECGLGLNKCSEAHPCPIHNEYKIARQLIEKIFREKMIKDLCDPVTNGLAFLMD
ncbi:MAG TPA: Rrf2 family transcriptional regulator [Niabella sp.]|nr:Rrf2 family transcriptional regulator [Niabella sp.]HOZ97041.1 Rrf2 family transcriptional regulator [Niabella sp.]HQW15031.1 Rrf2 family transcriptional regulator [Niabella sp.]HQX20077.1 Rrf2 family transcriptional regulator [Niabella sp.]HQX40411.1 Rrf2 family transcriptional regulator [Niabella sp.]